MASIILAAADGGQQGHHRCGRNLGLLGGEFLIDSNGAPLQERRQAGIPIAQRTPQVGDSRFGREFDLQFAGPSQVAGAGKEQNFQLRAKFASPLETALRYQRATGKDFYKALNKFLSMRRQRKPGN